MRRRTFTTLLPALLAGFVYARSRFPVPGAPPPAQPADPALDRALAQLFPSPAAARSVGIAYLRHHPERADRSLLIAELDPDFGLAQALDERSLRARVRARRRRDFSTGNTVVVNGWILSRTEANLCALAALS